MKKALPIVIVALLVVLVSCQTVTFQGIQAVKDMDSFTVVGDFERRIKDHRVIGGAGGFALLPLGQPDKDIFDVIQKEITKYSGDAAINVEIDYGFTLIDLLLNGFTAGVYAPSTITVKGTVVKYTD